MSGDRRRRGLLPGHPPSQFLEPIENDFELGSRGCVAGAWQDHRNDQTARCDVIRSARLRWIQLKGSRHGCRLPKRQAVIGRHTHDFKAPRTRVVEQLVAIWRPQRFVRRVACRGNQLLRTSDRRNRLKIDHRTSSLIGLIRDPLPVLSNDGIDRDRRLNVSETRRRLIRQRQRP